MFKFIRFLLLGFSLCACNPNIEKEYIIEGSIAGFDDDYEIYITYLNCEEGVWKEISDSTLSQNGKFCLKGNITGLTSASLSFDTVRIPFYLEPTTVKLTIHKDAPYLYECSGTSVDEENKQIRKILYQEMVRYDKTGNQGDRIAKQFDTYYSDPVLVDSLLKKIDSIKKELRISIHKLDSMKIAFVKEHNVYCIAPHLLYEVVRNYNTEDSTSNIISYDSLLVLYNNLPEHSQTTPLGQLALKQIEILDRELHQRELRAGDIAPNFSRKSIQGESIKLSNFKNDSYVLLDFWASWCGPCIKEIPTLKNISETNKELKIIGISLDSDKEEWINAVNKYQINGWSQILSDTNQDSYFRDKEDIAYSYISNGIPLYILIDKQGNIMKRWNHLTQDAINFIDSIDSEEN